STGVPPGDHRTLPNGIEGDGSEGKARTPDGDDGGRKRERGMTRVYYSLSDRILCRKNLREAFRKVKAAKGAPGIDGQSIADFAQDLEENLSMLARELREKEY